MPMYQILPVVLAALLVTFIASMRLAKLSADLNRPLFWARLALSASVLSLGSLLQREAGYAGTGQIIRYGWPKPFYFITYPEVGAPVEGWELIYFLGNASIYGAVALLACTGWRWLRR